VSEPLDIIRSLDERHSVTDISKISETLSARVEVPCVHMAKITNPSFRWRSCWVPNMQETKLLSVTGRQHSVQPTDILATETKYNANNTEASHWTRPKPVPTSSQRTCVW
jgi:hypothetical protein